MPDKAETWPKMFGADIILVFRVHRSQVKTVCRAKRSADRPLTPGSPSLQPSLIYVHTWNLIGSKLSLHIIRTNTARR